MKKAVVLLSGGIDSTTCLAYAQAEGYECYALSFKYGQRHSIELKAAMLIANHYHVHHKIFDLGIDQFGHSALTDKKIAVPHFKENNTIIPLTYVPARNTIFLAIALAWAEVIGAQDIFIGVSAIDYSNYPDCRPEFIHAFQTLANLATKNAVEGHSMRIHAPLIHLSKAETIQLGQKLGVDYAMTITCYQTNEQGQACGRCDSCMFRKKGFMEAGMPDVTSYY